MWETRRHIEGFHVVTEVIGDDELDSMIGLSRT